MKPFVFILNVPMNQKNHYSYFVGWVMVECSLKQMIKKMKKVIASSKYFTLSCDEVTMIHNQLWVSIHYYMVQDCCYLLILFFLKRIAKGGVQIISLKLLWVFWKDGGASNGDFAKKLMSFGSMFRVKNGVICQI